MIAWTITIIIAVVFGPLMHLYIKALRRRHNGRLSGLVELFITVGVLLAIVEIIAHQLFPAYADSIHLGIMFGTLVMLIGHLLHRFAPMRPPHNPAE